jgi:mannose-6-phosphate isomerase-like protein (cupin superfamily)
MQHWNITDLANTQSDRWSEFLRVAVMSMGVYKLPADSTDTQSPHTEDEAYYVVSGKATVEVDGEDSPVAAGSIVFVPAQVDHRFKDITEDLALLVFFAPAEGSQG